METDRNIYLVKNIIVFALTIIATKLITFLLVPIYTRYLKPAEFGIADLLFSMGMFIIPLITFNISESVYRFSMDKDSKTNKITSIIIITIIASMIEALLIIPVLSFFPNYSKYRIYYYFYIIASSISQVLSSNLKGQEKLKKMSICNTLFTLLVGIFNIIFLVILKMRIDGYFIAFIAANVITAIYAFIAGNVYDDIKKFDFDKKLFKEMIQYSIVLVPTSFMWWIINSSDRIMISMFLSDSANGIYAIAYKIPSFFITVLSIFTSAWVFSAIKEREKSDNERYSNSIYSKFLFVTIIFAIAVLTFIKPFLKIYVSNSYYISWYYVPPLLIGGIFLSLSNYLATFYTANKDSKGLLYSTTFGAIMNLLLNLMLIPITGIMGAAIATLISYLVVFIYRFYNVRKYIKLTFGFKNNISFCCLLLSVLFVYLNKNYSICLNILLLIIVVVINRKDICSFLRVTNNSLKSKLKLH